MNADLDVLLDTALDAGLPDHVVISLARVINLMWLQDRRSVTLPVTNLMAYLGMESRNTLDAHLRAYARVPGLTVKKASGHVLIHYRPPLDERAMAAQPARSPDGASEAASMVAQSLPNSRAVAAQASHDGDRGTQSARNERAAAAQFPHSEGNDAQSLPNGRAMAAQSARNKGDEVQPTRNERAVGAQSARNGRAIGGEYKGGLARVLAVTETKTDVITLLGLSSEQASARAEGGGGSVRGEGETVSTGAQWPRNGRATGAQWLLNDRAMTVLGEATVAQSAPNGRAASAQSARSERTTTAQSAHNGRAVHAQSVVDEASVDAFLEALKELGNGRPMFGGQEMSRADVRAVLEAASRQGHPLDLVLAEALSLEDEFRRKGKAMGTPVALLRYWAARPDLAEYVPHSLRQEARKLLGLEEGENETNAGESVAVEIVGDPPYDPVQVWQQAKGRLREEMEGREYNTWLKDARLLAWQDGEFVVGVPNVLARDWVSKRLNGHVSRALAQFAGLKEGDVSVRYVVAPIE